jgi:NAD(P)-dependent dehydrogenase (short-subunit alcohol dehydrogenase family)
MTVEGKRIVVTGAGRGIGAGLTALLRSRGATVITADLNPEGVDVACDISDPAGVEKLFAFAGDVDGLVNNAGLLVGRRDYDDVPLDEWDRMFAVNVRGTYLCAKAAAANMRTRSDSVGNPAGGAIVNIASETAFTGSHGFVHYQSTSQRTWQASDSGQLRCPRVHADTGFRCPGYIRSIPHSPRPGDEA